MLGVGVRCDDGDHCSFTPEMVHQHGRRARDTIDLSKRLRTQENPLAPESLREDRQIAISVILADRMTFHVNVLYTRRRCPYHELTGTLSLVR
jgi:hypothetical protein